MTNLELAGDVGDPDQAGQLIEAAVAAYGGIDILVNNVGGGGGGARIDVTRGLRMAKPKTSTPAATSNRLPIIADNPVPKDVPRMAAQFWNLQAA